MKKSMVLFALLVSLPFIGSAKQIGHEQQRLLLGEKAPEFVAETTNGKLKFPNDFGNSWKILFSHPADFTPVCTSELLELCNEQKNFLDLNVKFAVLSSDMIDRHKSWVESMEGLTYKHHSSYKINFPLIADPKLKISSKYGMIHPEMSSTKNVRGVFIIDPSNKIRSIMYYPMEIGRNIDEIKRTVQALQKHDEEKVFTPANWNKGDDVIVPFLSNMNNFEQDKLKIKNEDTYAVSWYLFLKPDTK